MDLDKIRNMDYTDFMIHCRICLARENVDKEFKLNLAGVDTRKKVSPEEALKNIPKKGGGPHRTKTTENIIRF